jgi:hypothetical protein
MIVGLTIPLYERIQVGRARAIAAKTCTSSLREILEKDTLYEYAARQPDAVPLVGRAPVFAVNLPGGCGRAVVRHNMRGVSRAARVTSPAREWSEHARGARLRVLSQESHAAPLRCGNA